MSDASQGAGWWRASDGRWYPPELHPDRQVPAAPIVPPGQGIGWSPHGPAARVGPDTWGAARPSWPPDSARVTQASGRRPWSSSREVAAPLAAAFGVAAVGYVAWTVAERGAAWPGAPWPQYVLPALAICFGLMGRSRWRSTQVGRALALVGIVTGAAALAAVPASAQILESEGVVPAGPETSVPIGPVGSEAPSSGAPVGPSPLCVAAQQISDLEDAIAGPLNDFVVSVRSLDDWTAGWPGVIAAMEAQLPALQAAYELMKEGRPELAADVDLVSSFTLSSFEAFSRVSSPDQFEAMAGSIDPEEAYAASAAVFRLDRVTRAECGIVLAD